MKKTFLVVALSALFFAGCGEEEKAYTEEYYKNNPEAMMLQIEKCEKAEKLSATEMTNCENAKSANASKKQREWNF